MNRALLEEPFPKELVRTRKGSFGNELSYVEAAHYVRRLNDAFEGQWGFKILGHENQGTEVVVHGMLEAGGQIKHAFGNSSITTNSSTREVVSFGDDLKAAATDALKKACSLFGIGLDLYGSSPSQSNPSPSKRPPLRAVQDDGQNRTKSWLMNKKASGRRFSTLVSAAQILEQHILPVLGELYVDAITGQDVRDWLTFSATKEKKKRKLKKKTKKPRKKKPGGQIKKSKRYASVSVNGWLRLLKNVLRDAVADFGLDRDPTIRIAALQEDPKEDASKSLTADELRWVLGAAKALVEKKEIPAIMYTILLVGFFTGMRWSELSALEWKDLDEEGPCIRIRRGQVRQHVSGTKTRKTRTVAIPEFVLEELREHRKAQIRDQVKGLEKGIVFPSRVGNYRCPSSLVKALPKICNEAGISKTISPHWMRHTLNNLMRQAKVDRIVLRATTGHAAEEMTEHYSHVSLDEKREASAKVVQMVGLEPGRKGVEKG
jgi:integrase